MRALVSALLLVGAALQLWHFAVSEQRRLAALPTDIERFVAAEPGAPLNAQMVAYRTLPALARAIPPHARTLLVTPVYDPIQYEFYFVPRPFRLLLQLPPPAVVAQIARARPEHAHLLRMRQDAVDARGLAFTPERFAAALGRADFLVTFAWDGFDPAAAPRRLELLARRGPAALYRVLPP